MNHPPRRALIVLAATLSALAPVGCTRTVSSGSGTGSASANAETKTDPWPAAAADVRKQPDAGTSRRVLNQINADLTRNPAADAPQEMAPAAAKTLADTLRLTPDEVAEITGKAYTALDAAYLSESLYARDAARSLDPAGRPPQEQAAVLFDWVCRQVYLKPWEIGRTQDSVSLAPCVPPTYVLRRGYGTGLERAYVMLAVLRQAGLDGCLIGPPGKEQAPSTPVVGGKQVKGPFWAVGARAGDDIVLFDPWRGQPLPGPGGKGIATLAQVKANPDQLKPWFEDKANPWDVTPADLKAATAYVALPLSAVSPRMKLLDAKFATEVGVKLAADPAEQAAAVGKAAGGTAHVWAPPANVDMYCFTRALPSFLPIDEGGTDRTPPPPRGRQLFGLLTSDPLKLALYARPPELGAAAAPAMNDLLGRFAGVFQANFVETAPREKIHRGQFKDVVQTLVKQEDAFRATQDRYRTDPRQAEAVRAWCQKANQVYDQLTVAQLPENRAALPEAEAAVARFWREETAGQQAVIDQAVATAGLAEAGYLLALAKHEQAERAQLRLDRATDATRPRAVADAKAAWATAKDAWDRYAPYADLQDKAFPGRAAHARRLAERAATRGG